MKAKSFIEVYGETLFERLDNCIAAEDLDRVQIQCKLSAKAINVKFCMKQSPAPDAPMRPVLEGFITVNEAEQKFEIDQIKTIPHKTPLNFPYYVLGCVYNVLNATNEEIIERPIKAGKTQNIASVEPEKQSAKPLAKAVQTRTATSRETLDMLRDLISQLNTRRTDLKVNIVNDGIGNRYEVTYYKDHIKAVTLIIEESNSSDKYHNYYTYKIVKQLADTETTIDEIVTVRKMVEEKIRLIRRIVNN